MFNSLYNIPHRLYEIQDVIQMTTYLGSTIYIYDCELVGKQFINNIVCVGRKINYFHYACIACKIYIQ